MSKYNARKIQTDYGIFDSKKEYQRWDELLKKQAKGDISNLRRQVPFLLIPTQYVNGKLVERKCEYVADFVYVRNGETIVEDVKGYRKGPAYSYYVIKRKLMLEKHGIQIKEI